MSWHRTLAAFAILLLVALVVPPPSAAQAQAVPVINSWALAPSGTNPGEPGSRPNLTYDLAAGASIKDSVTLLNYGNTPLTFHLYATDAFNDAAGAFDLLPGDKKPIDLGTWISLPQPNITVKARTSVVLPISITVPPDASPGDHTAAILASNAIQGRSPDGKIVTLDRRTGSRVYVRVQGPLQPFLTVENINSAYHPALNSLAGSLDVTYTVHNGGNQRLGTHQLVQLNNPFGRRMKQSAPPDIQELLPGNSVTFHAHFDKVTAAVFVTAQIALRPFPVGAPRGTAASRASRSRRSWAVPWTLLAVLTVVGVAWQAVRRYRARPKGAAGPPAPTGPNAPDGSGAPTSYATLAS